MDAFFKNQIQRRANDISRMVVLSKSEQEDEISLFKSIPFSYLIKLLNCAPDIYYDMSLYDMTLNNYELFYEALEAGEKILDEKEKLESDSENPEK